jgi:hypothetical protein
MAPKRKSAAPTPESALEQLQKSQSLKLLAIAETLSPKDLPQTKKRNSAASEDSEGNSDTHPAALEADLVHYKVCGTSAPLRAQRWCTRQELFSKLRFSYVEQVTKEKFLRSITENPPRLVEAPENDEKEQEILALKASLKERKLEVVEILSQLEAKGRELSLRYEGLQLRTQQLESLPVEIKGLEATIEQLRQEQTPTSDNPELSLPLPETERILGEREAELAALNAQIATLQATLPNRARELEKLERELKPLETQKNGTVAAAKEARRRKEEGGGIGDELEERGRWLQASEKALRDMLEVWDRQEWGVWGRIEFLRYHCFFMTMFHCQSRRHFLGFEFIQIHPWVMMRSERNDAKPGEMAVMPAQAFGGFECSAVRLEWGFKQSVWRLAALATRQRACTTRILPRLAGNKTRN